MQHFYRFSIFAARCYLCVRAAYAVVRCLSACLSRSCIVSKRVMISSNFFISSHTTLVFATKSYGNISTGTPERGIELRGYEKSRFSTNYLMLNISKTVRDRDIVTAEYKYGRTHAYSRASFRMTLSDL